MPQNQTGDLLNETANESHSLNTVFFTTKNIPELIKKLSKENGDDILVNNLKTHRLKCEICNRNISKSFENLGGLIRNKKGKWIILCTDLYCYNKSL